MKDLEGNISASEAFDKFHDGVIGYRPYLRAQGESYSLLRREFKQIFSAAYNLIKDYFGIK
ncbi:MAG: hypothetical protein ABIE22_00510 [archaeon]